jgi:hypothetical protein
MLATDQPNVMEFKAMTRTHTTCQIIAAVLIASAAAAESPYATKVISYHPGDPQPILTDPTKALGEPSRMNHDPWWETVVTAFNPAFIDIVSIGPGGHLTLAFDSPVVNDPNHPFGIDLIVFGNSFFTDSNPQAGIVGGLVQDGGIIEVSADGIDWFVIPGVVADGLHPTIAYIDSGPYDKEPGKMPTDFTRPVDPSLTMSNFLGLTNDEVVELYNGSGGGAGVDISAVGLESVQYVRISNPPDSFASVEVDAIAKVAPEVTADLNGDGIVDGADLLILLSQWGVCPPKDCPADLNGDGVVDGADLLILLSNWG